MVDMNCEREMANMITLRILEILVIGVFTTYMSRLIPIQLRLKLALQRFVKKSIGDFGQSTSPGLIAI